MQRSTSQKWLFVLSIIEIVGGALALIVGIMGMLGTGVIASDPSLVAGSGVSQAEAAGAFLIVSVIALVEGVWCILCGIFGIRAANDNQKIMIVWVFCLIALIMNIVAIIMCFINGSVGSQVGSSVFSAICSGVMFFIANNIKREAGK